MSPRDPEPMPPILRQKHHDAPSVFRPENLLREARRQKRVPAGEVPRVCILDPDGDIVDYLRGSGAARPSPSWVCYHTELIEFDCEGLSLGIVGRAVGAPFAVLVAEELFASGCEFLISMTSAGQIAATAPPPYFVVIEKALRDEGTSYHYLPPSEYAEIGPMARALSEGAFDALAFPVRWATTWTTDAPFRETDKAVASCESAGVSAVEMEASALYAFSLAQGKPVLCLAHVTNTMARDEGDFEKGAASGSLAALEVIAAAAKRWFDRARPPRRSDGT